MKVRQDLRAFAFLMRVYFVHLGSRQSAHRITVNRILYQSTFGLSFFTFCSICLRFLKRLLLPVEYMICMIYLFRFIRTVIALL